MYMEMLMLASYVRSYIHSYYKETYIAKFETLHVFPKYDKSLPVICS